MHKKGAQPNTVNSDVQRQCFKTKLCAFFPLNKCQKGANCPFAHDSSEMRDQPDWRKTKVCLMWKSNNCDKPADLCNYAHGAQELRRGVTPKNHVNNLMGNDKRLRNNTRRSSKDVVSDSPILTSNKKSEVSQSDDVEQSSPTSKDDSNSRFQSHSPMVSRNYNNVAHRKIKGNYDTDWLDKQNLYCGSPLLQPANEREMFRPSVGYMDRRFMESSPMITATPDLVANNGSNDELFMDFSGYASPTIAESPHMNDNPWNETPVLVRGSCSLHDNSSLGEEPNYLYQSPNSPAYTNDTISSPHGLEASVPWSPPIPHTSPLMVPGYEFRSHFREDRRGIFGRDVNTLGSEDCTFPRK